MALVGCPGGLVCFDNNTSLSPCVAQAGGLTLWVKRTDVPNARYTASLQVGAASTVDEFIARWVAERRLDMDPGLVSLRLLSYTGEEEPTPEQEASATVLQPRKTMAQAGVTDGSWLLAVVISQTAATEGELHDDLRSLSPRSVSLSHSPGVSLRAPMRLSCSL